MVDSIGGGGEDGRIFEILYNFKPDKQEKVMMNCEPPSVTH